MHILVPNLGSTSLKYQILDMPGERVLASGRFERVTDYRSAIGDIRSGDTSVDAVAFKSVHAGPHYRGTFVIDDGVEAAMREFLLAAPVHNAIYLTAIDAFREAMPGVPLVGAFETEFHRTMPDFARWYGVPSDWRTQFGIERYGFHGASHEFMSGRVPEFLGRAKEDLRVISCHLGGSSSVCAIEHGKSIDTTMGFSPQSGLENATRHGDLDVFAVLYMMDRNNWTTEEVRRQLARNSGLAGLSGIAGGDVRDISAAAQGGNHDAALALDVFTYQVRKTIGAYTAAMAGVDAIVFTGGIGENSAVLRSNCCRGLEHLGVELDAARNENGQGDRLLSSDKSRVKVLALAANEEVVVARRAYRALTAKP
ncbi:acetate/propionate family kinase [uncultured Paludibaculum sp.]|uniref:acetate/propionate family kinase n=1 Tax=uncultured Paludibaculum sp. TaxID=1765020 RepID=UPI002AAC0B9D|nr:acetate/propionate family kinase [uncultured Paludibaculum sp.]